MGSDVSNFPERTPATRTLMRTSRKTNAPHQLSNWVPVAVLFSRRIRRILLGIPVGNEAISRRALHGSACRWIWTGQTCYFRSNAVVSLVDPVSNSTTIKQSESLEDGGRPTNPRTCRSSIFQLRVFIVVEMFSTRKYRLCESFHANKTAVGGRKEKNIPRKLFRPKIAPVLFPRLHRARC